MIYMVFKDFSFDFNPKKTGRNGSKPADLVIMNAEILTCDDKNPHAEAVAVKNGVITYVGYETGMEDYVGPDTEIIDANKRTLTPGFVDNHCHVIWIGALTGLMTTELFNCDSLEEFEAALKNHRLKNPDLPVLMGVGWRYHYLPQKTPTIEFLDSLIEDIPVILMSYDGQAGWINSVALKLMKERNPLAFTKLAPAVDEKTGDYLGIFRHFHAFDIFDYFSRDELGKAALEKMERNISHVLQEALSFGVTTMNDVQIYPSFIPGILEFRDKGGLDHVRICCSYYISPHDLKDVEKLKKDLESWKEVGHKESDSHLKMGSSLKFYIDGVFSNRTGFLLEPYSDDPSSYGEEVWSQDEFDRVIEIIDKMGFQACTHCCGDAGIRRIVNSYERAMQVNGKRDARHRLDHCELPQAGEMERMQRLGLYAAMQPNHFFADEKVEKALGRKRLNGYMPYRSLEKAGVHLSFGSDWCAGPINPMYGLLLATMRFNYKGDTDWGPDEAISVENAIRHWTIDSARAMFMEDCVGSIEVGKYGDMVLWNQNLLKITSLWFLLTHDLELGKLDDFVDITFVEGKTVYFKG